MYRDSIVFIPTLNDYSENESTVKMFLPQTSHKSGHGGDKGEEDVEEEEDGEVDVIAVARTDTGNDVIVAPVHRRPRGQAGAGVKDCLVRMAKGRCGRTSGHTRAEVGRAGRQVADGLVEG